MSSYLFTEIVTFIDLKASLLIPYLCDLVISLSVDKFTGSFSDFYKIMKPSNIYLSLIDCIFTPIRNNKHPVL